MALGALGAPGGWSSISTRTVSNIAIIANFLQTSVYPPPLPYTHPTNWVYGLMSLSKKEYCFKIVFDLKKEYCFRAMFDLFSIHTYYHIQD